MNGNSMTGRAPSKRKYRVMVDDNFHSMDGNEHSRAVEYDSCEKAVEACKRIVEDFLRAEYQPKMTAEQLMRLFRSFGEDPYVLTRDEDCSFSSGDYAEQRCKEICGEGG